MKQSEHDTIETALEFLKENLDEVREEHKWNITEEDIINFCKQHLARYKAPKKVIFMKKLPKSPQGKILKRKLREPFWKGRERQVV